jgi:hypothetical protein
MSGRIKIMQAMEERGSGGYFPKDEPLMQTLRQHGMHHLAKVESDLDQTEALLAEAIERLCISFQGVASTVAAHHSALAPLLARGDALVDGPGMQKLSDTLNGHVNAAVASLQFHDLSSQLLARARNRVNGVQGMLAACDGAEGSGGLLHQAGPALLETSARLDRELCQSVRQRQMDSGEIELF